MIILIVTITIILYIILISSTMHNLNSIESNKAKIGFIILGLFIIAVSTLITFYISKSGVNYENVSMIKNIRNVLLAVFIPVNGLILMPYLGRQLSKIGAGEITQEAFKRRLIILAIICLAVLIFECMYFKRTQLGILEMINKN